MNRDIQAEVYDLSRKYTHFLAETDLGLENVPAWNALQPKEPGRLVWNEPENLDTGLSGVILFLMELYTRFPEDACAGLIDQSINNLIQYCKKQETNNYALYTGRGSVIYVLMQRYLMNNDESLLKEALELIAPADKGYLHSKYTTDYLYDGRSGTLLVLLQLYQLTNASFLLKYIHQFILKILSGAHLSSEGIFWKGEEELNLKPLCGFAYGVSGIKYVFDMVGRHCPDAVIGFISREAARYVDTCRAGNGRGWYDFRRSILHSDALTGYKNAYLNKDLRLFAPEENPFWENGTIGVICSMAEPDEGTRFFMEKEIRNILAGNASGPYSLYSGLSGWALCYLTLTQNVESPELQELTCRIIDKLAGEEDGIDLQGGLLHGRLGAMYFLLKMISGKSNESAGGNVLRPYFEGRLQIGLSLSFPEVKADLVSRYYPRTISLMKKTAPAALTLCFDDNGNEAGWDELEKFARFMEGIAAVKMDVAVRERIADLFSLEKNKTAFLLREKRSPFQVYLDALLYKEKILPSLNGRKEWILNQRLSVSPDIAVFNTRWNWCFANDFNQLRASQMDNLTIPAAEFRYLVLISEKYEPVEFLLTKDTEGLLQLFSTSRSIGQVLAEVKSYTQSLPPETLKNFVFETTGTRDVRDFISHLDDITLYKIREWIYRGILIVDVNTFTNTQKTGALQQTLEG